MGQSPFAEGLVVDSPQDEGCPPTLLSSPQSASGGRLRRSGGQGVETGFGTHPPHQTPTGHQGRRRQAGCEVIKKMVNAGRGIEGFRDAEEVALKRQ